VVANASTVPLQSMAQQRGRVAGGGRDQQAVAVGAGGVEADPGQEQAGA
jgi:hypothetical protein